MPAYANLGGASGVASFNMDATSITVTFKDGAAYLYNYRTPGRDDVEEMKSLAECGQGLNSYISRFVKKRYASKLRSGFRSGSW